MKLTGILFIVFGALLIVGGVMGYLKALSYASLIAGTLLGFTTLLLGLFTLRGSILSENSALVVTLLVDLFFAYRMLQTKAFIPAGLMTLISSIVVIATCVSIKKRLSKTVN